MKFTPGQEVTPIFQDFKILVAGELTDLPNAPKFGKEYVVIGYSQNFVCECGQPCLLLKGFPDTSLMCENCFDPLPTKQQVHADLGIALINRNPKDN